MEKAVEQTSGINVMLCQGVPNVSGGGKLAGLRGGRGAARAGKWPKRVARFPPL